MVGGQLWGRDEGYGISKWIKEFNHLACHKKVLDG